MKPKTIALRVEQKRGQRGFTLIEVMISMVILTVGLVSLLGVLGMAMAATQGSQENEISKQLANEALESILTARETSQVTWGQIQSQPAGIFVTGLTSIYNAGADGIYGTNDDAASGLQTLTLPGPDGIYGTADDVQVPLNYYQRQIQIVPVVLGGNNDPTLRQITVTIQYTPPQIKAPRTYVLNTFISQFR